jgi:hypothetical protein
MTKFQIVIIKVLKPVGYFLIGSIYKVAADDDTDVDGEIDADNDAENDAGVEDDLFYFQVQEARGQHDDEAVKRAINEYEDTLGRYIPVLMAQAKIYWELEMYQQVRTKLISIIEGAA